jgi:hypothetical protein
MLIIFSPLHLILCSSPVSCRCHANKNLNFHVVKQLELYVCVGIPIPLNLNKLHCIIIAISCMHASHDHANSFAVVVNVAYIACCSDLLLLG